MKADVIPARQLSPELVLRWRAIQQADASLESPFFCPEFAQVAGECCPKTFIGVIEDAGRIIGFVPFERIWGGAARGIAHQLADYQGIILDPSANLSARDLLRACRISSLEFVHVLASQGVFGEFHREPSRSYMIDLTEGREAYRRAHNNRNLRSRARQAAQEVGPIRADVQTSDPQVMEGMIAMKRRQFARTGIGDAFADKTIREMTERLNAIQTPAFAGMLSSLYIGDTLAAAQFGIRSTTVMHGLFTTYNEELARYSPGMLMLQSLIDGTETHGVAKLDLGFGDETYKPRVANAQVMVSSALVGASLTAKWQQCVRKAKQQLRGTAVGNSLKRVKGYFRPAASPPTQVEQAPMAMSKSS